MYSTCSLEPEEDEQNVKWFIEEFEDMELLPISLCVGDTPLEKTRKLWPHKTGTQGFFIAKFKKKT